VRPNCAAEPVVNPTIARHGFEIFDGFFRFHCARMFPVARAGARAHGSQEPPNFDDANSKRSG